MIAIVLMGMRDTVIQKYYGKKQPINPISLDYREIVYLDTRTNDNASEFYQRQETVRKNIRVLEKISKSCILAEVKTESMPLKTSYYLKGFQE